MGTQESKQQLSVDEIQHIKARRRKVRETGVVLLLALILLAIFLPQFRHHHEQTGQITCAGNIRCRGICLKMFANDNGGKLPPIARIDPSTGKGYQWWFDMIARYGGNDGEFICPNDVSILRAQLPGPGPGTMSVAGRCSYVYRDCYRYRDADGNRCIGCIPAQPDGSFPDVSSIAVMRCSRGWNGNTVPPTSMNQAAVWSYTNYGNNAYEGCFTGVKPLPGRQPINSTRNLNDKDNPASGNLLHGDGTNFLYLDGHVGWKSKDVIGRTVDDTMALRKGIIPDAF